MQLVINIINIHPNHKVPDVTIPDVTNLDEEPIIRTGMKLKLDTGNEYTLVVRGDINCDGNITKNVIYEIQL